MTNEKIKGKQKNWIFQECIIKLKVKWTFVVSQEFLEKDNSTSGELLLLTSNDEFLKFYKTITELDKVIFETYQDYYTRKTITLYCPANPGHFWNKYDSDKLRKEIYDFLVLYVMKLNNEQVLCQMDYFLGKFDKIHHIEDIYQTFVKNSTKSKEYLLYLITILFLYENEDDTFKKQIYNKKAANFIDMVKKDFYEKGQQIYAEAFGMEFDDDVRIYLLKMASEHFHIEASFELAEFYKFCIKANRADYSWQDVISIYKRIESIDESGRASWALGKIAEKGYNTEKIDYISAKAYYINSKKHGYPKAYNSLANLYWKKLIAYDDDVKNIDDIINLYQSAINKGNTYAYINLGHIYSSEEYNCKDLRKAEKYYEKASERNSELAKYFQAKLYLDNREEFSEINDFCLINMFTKMTNYSKQFQYLGKVYGHLAQLLKQNGSLESEILRILNVSINQGSLIDRLNKIAWDNGDREVIYDLAISIYNNEDDNLIRNERVLQYLEQRSANNISDKVKQKCNDLYDYIMKTQSKQNMQSALKNEQARVYA